MPAVSEKQRKFMGAELGRLRAGKATKTHMSESQLREYAKKKRKRRSVPRTELSDLVGMRYKK